MPGDVSLPDFRRRVTAKDWRRRIIKIGVLGPAAGGVTGNRKAPTNGDTETLDSVLKKTRTTVRSTVTELLREGKRPCASMRCLSWWTIYNGMVAI